MRKLKSGRESLIRMYRRGIVVREVAEALLSLDIGTSTDFVRTFLASHDFDVVGVSKEGRLIGYVEVHNLASEPLVKSVQDIKITEVLSDDTPIAELIEVLSVKERVFVRSLEVL